MKKLIKQVFRSFGYDLRKYMPLKNFDGQIKYCLDELSINTLFDIGANIGQFAQEIRLLGYRGKIVSFEPLSVAHEILMERSRLDSDWFVHDRCAIGELDGETVINISKNSVSSSILPMLDAHSTAEKDSVYVSKELTLVSRLDSISPSYIDESSRIFIKIDTQGYEWQVLNGASGIIDRAFGVMIELSLVPLYKNQHLWVEVIQRLESRGFILFSIQPGFADPRSGRLLQVDAIFIRSADNDESKSLS